MTQKTYDLGLVLAGAISAGAYTAGVIDFLCQALSEWERLRQPGYNVPDHGVRLRVAAGASAGGMVGAMLVGALARQAQPVEHDPGPSCANPLFNSWVNRVDILPLLDSQDLVNADGALPPSLLDTSLLDDIAREALVPPSRPPVPPVWLHDNFDLLLTVTNLRGVPYVMQFPSQQVNQGMVMHADYLHFSFLASQAKAVGDPAYSVAWADFAQAPWLDLLKTGALATGAFPVALAPRVLDLPDSSLYSRRQWDRDRFWRAATSADASASPPLPAKADQVFGRDRVSPPCDLMPKQYGFGAVDGGTMNNAPFDLAHQVLHEDQVRAQQAGSNSGSRSWLDASGMDTRQGLVLVAPFPGGERTADKYSPPANFVASFTQLVGAWMDQSRFRPVELLDAMNESEFSRFMVSPSRDQGGQKIVGAKAIACGSLGGFGGFLERQFRAHDFFLGRQNCQSFLRQHFVLRASNALFSDSYRSRTAPIYKCGVACLPIIPLLGSAAEKLEYLPFPSLARTRLDDVMAKVETRYDNLTDHAIDKLLDGQPVKRFAARTVRNFYRGKAMDKIEGIIQDGLKAHGIDIK